MVFLNFPKYLLLGIFFTGCSLITSPQYTDAGFGVQIKIDETTLLTRNNNYKTAIKVITQTIQDNLYPDKDLFKLLDGVKITICDTSLMEKRPAAPTVITTVCKSGDTFISGEFIKNKIIHFAWRGKYYNSALGHELLHYFVYKIDFSDMHTIYGKLEDGTMGVKYLKDKYLEVDKLITKKLTELDI